MGNQSVNVSLNFTAQTGQAKASIQELQTLLNKIGSSGLGIDKNTLDEENKKIKAASEAAIELQNHLNNAFNVKTGKLDLSLFDKSLKSSGDNITNLTSELLKSGDVGQQAFVKLAQSISMADQPMFKINSKLQDFAANLKKTMSWQLSNNVIRGFMSAISTAYGYAQDLNASLTDIRIVTGKDADEMARFAESANKAAKALSTTTTDYTKGSLIYFQQGLTDQEVAERTETTIKMANVTGESTSKIADQMTAVWNNFADGSKELSYYADVMTALGAATASSSDEISEGINKFAATAKTVGLSYEYATAALATVTARTRESADVVGNAFKTLFARIQGLNQGDTLDDGTTLNKYSSALDKVGVNIKATSGELKDMNAIIDELGPKWKTLADDQKMALAQTVAGVRQYSQFMALMNNYDYFKENVGVAEQSTGTLQKQADIYAESWEAASKRVRASAESLYQDLIDDKFFISINNGIANILSGLDAFIDKAGGLKTVITGVSGVFLSAFASKIPDAINTVKYNFEVLTKGSQKAYQSIFAQMQESTNKAFSDNNIDPKSSIGLEIRMTNALATAKNQYMQVQDKLSESEKQQAQTKLALMEASKQEIVLEQQKIEAAKKSAEEKKASFSEKEFYNWNSKGVAQSQKIMEGLGSETLDNFKDTKQKNQVLKSYENFIQSLKNYQKTIPASMRELNREILNSMDGDGNFTKAINPFKSLNSKKGKDQLSLTFKNLKETASVTFKSISDNFAKELEAVQKSIDPTVLKMTGLDEKFKQFIETAKGGVDNNQAKKMVEELKESLKNAEIPAEKLKETLSNWHGEGGITGLISALQKVSEEETNIQGKTDTLIQQFKEFEPDHVVHMSEAFASLAGGIMNANTIAQSFTSIAKSINDDDLNTWEKLVAIASGLTSFGFGLNGILTNAGKVGAFVTDLAPKLGIFSGLVTGIAGAIGPVLTGLLAIGAAGAVLWGIVSAFKAIKENSPEGKLEKTKEFTEGLSQAAEDATNKYQELLNTIDSYDSAIDKLNGLETGTAEFSAALLDANDKAWDLINTLGLLPSDWHYGEHGEIVIDTQSDAVQEKLKQQQEAREDLNAAMTGSKAYEARQSQAIEDNNFQSKYRTDLQTTFKALGITDGNLENFNKIQQLQGKGLQDEEFRTVAKEMASTFGLEASKIFSEDYDENGNKIYDTANIDALGYVELLKDIASGKTDVEGIYNSRLKDQSIVENANLNSLLTSLANEKEYQDSKYGGLIADSVAKGMQDNIDRIAEETTQEDADKKYEQMIKAAGGVVETDDKGVKHYYSDSDKTNEITSTVEDRKQAMAEVQATTDAEDDVINRIKALNDVMSDIKSDNIKSYMDAIASGGDISKLTKDQIQVLRDNGNNISKFISTELGDVGKEVFGKDVWQGFIDKIDQAIRFYQPGSELDIDSWKTQYSQLQDVIDKVSSGKEIDAATYSQLGEEYQQYFSEQADGNYKLIGLASNFKEIVESTEIGKLKEATQSFNAVTEKIAQTGTTYNDIQNYAKESNNVSNTAFVEAMGYSTEGATSQEIVELTQQAAQAYLEMGEKALDSSKLIAQLSDNVQDLDKNFKDGLITADDYNKKFKELSSALDEDVDESTFKNFSDMLQDLDEGALAAKGFSKELKENSKAADDVAESILRYDKAVERVNKNSNEWKKILASGNLQDVAEITDDLANSYEDLLNISKGSLRNSFVTNAENLDLMTRAAQGSVEAYDELAKRANEDIIAQCKLETDFDQTKFDAALADLNSEIAGLDLPDIEVGTNLMGKESFIAACNDLINAAGMTAAQATDYLANMGIDATVVEDTKPVEEEVATAVRADNYRPIRVPLGFSFMGVSDNSGYVEVPAGVNYTTSPVKATRQVKGTGLRVESATKSSGGNIKFQNSSAGSGSGSRKSSGSGSGGKGSTKASTHADSKSFSDKDRYHTIKNQLEDLQASYDAIDKAKSRAFGKDKLKAMDQEIKKNDELIDKQKEYVNEIENYLGIDKKIMEDAYSEYIGGPAIEYDKDGNISNFEEIQQAMFDKYNQMAGSNTEDSDEWKKFEKQYELLEKYIAQYEETYDLARDEKDKMTDLINQKIDLGLEKVKYTVEISLEVPEDSIKVLDYKLGRLKDTSSDAMESVTLLINKMGQINDKIAVTKNGLADTLKLSMSEAEITEILNGNFEALNQVDENGEKRIKLTEDQVEAIRDYKNSLIDLNSELDEIRENIESKVMVVFNDWQNKLKQGTEVLDHYTSTLESYKNIIDIVGKDTLGIASSFMNDLVQSTVDVAIDKLKSTKSSYEAIVEARDRAQERLNQAQADKDQESIKMWQDTLDTINEQVRSSNEEMMSAWEDALNTIADSFEQTVNNLVDTFEKSVYALGGLDGLSDDFSRQQENADLMLDDYQKIYELSKLSRDINKTIDDTNSISGKQKLKKLLEQINKLQAEGNEMSKYDLEYLQKTYDLRQAEIELEEAQRAKNTVRLQKDSEGNWSYIYTQSSDAIDSAQQKYEDALYAMQDLSSNYIDEISEKLISTSKDMEEALANIRVQDYANINDYYAQVEKVQSQYQEQLDKQQGELQKALDNNKILYDTDWKNYHEATGYKISDTENFATKFKDTMLGTLLKSESDNADFTKLIQVSTDSLVTGLNAAAEAYYTNIAKAMEAAGTSTKDFAEEVKKSVDSIKSNSAKATKSVQKMADNMGTAFDQITKTVGAWQETYGQQMQKIRDENLAVVDSFNAMLKAMSIDPNEFRVSYDFSKINKNDSDASSLDTGGYTGNWGPDGRIAVLHQKELVLNEHDTSNMLAAVQMTRSILETIDLNARQAQIGLGAMVAGKLPEEQKETLQQEVHITAEFPNVNDHNEIEEAFNNLINQASQYANRK